MLNNSDKPLLDKAFRRCRGSRSSFFTITHTHDESFGDAPALPPLPSAAVPPPKAGQVVASPPAHHLESQGYPGAPNLNLEMAPGRRAGLEDSTRAQGRHVDELGIVASTVSR